MVRQPGPLARSLILLGGGTALVYTFVLAAATNTFVPRYSTDPLNPWNLFPAAYVFTTLLIAFGFAAWYREGRRQVPETRDWSAGLGEAEDPPDNHTAKD